MAKRRGRKEGSFRRRKDGLWEGTISLGAHPTSGRRVRKSVYAATKQEVIDKLLELKRKEFLDVPDAGDLTVGRFLTKDFLEAIAPEVRSNTWNQYEYVTRRYLVPMLGGVLMNKVSPLHVQAFLTGLTEAKPALEDTRRGKVPSPRLRQLCFAVLRRAFKHAVVLGLIARNPCEGIKQPKVPPKKMATWTKEQVQHFIEATKDDRLHALYVLALMTGARQGELLGLQWKDVDLEAGTITVSGTLLEVKGQIVGVAAPKTPAAMRTISLSPIAVDALKRHQIRMFEEGKRACPIVFPNSRRLVPGWLGKSSLTAQFKEAVTKAGLPMIRWHDLRHTAITAAIATGADIKTIATRAGHSKPSVTLDVYSHAFAGHDRKLAASVEELIFGVVRSGEHQ